VLEFSLGGSRNACRYVRVERSKLFFEQSREGFGKPLLDALGASLLDALGVSSLDVLLSEVALELVFSQVHGFLQAPVCGFAQRSPDDIAI